MPAADDTELDSEPPYVAPVARPVGRAPHPLTVLLTVAATAGFVFAAVATYDFVAHLDRQVHGLHCSFLPGLEAPDVSGSSGCHTTLMSPYSSVLRTKVWGGIPIALPAMSVFAFLALWGVFLVLTRRQREVPSTLFLLLATLLPVIASGVMGYLSLVTLGTACKLCVGIYVASGVCFFCGVALHVRARGGSVGGPPALGLGALAEAFAVGVLFVAVPAFFYAGRAPDFDSYVGACGQLEDLEDPGGVLLPIGPPAPRVPVLEVLDPLCPACRGFESASRASRRRTGPHAASCSSHSTTRATG